MTTNDPQRSVIRFNKFTPCGGIFSNFSPHSITLKGKSWPTVEHYFQAQKFTGMAYEEEIRTSNTNPAMAKKMGGTRKISLRKDWETVKEQVMTEALVAKFTQHASLGQTLIATGNAVLVENAPHDRYWGDGGNGTGQNRLGECLEHVRRLLVECTPK